MVKIRYQKLRENAVLPYAATEMSGGLDLTAAHIERVNGREVLVYLGFAMQPPPGYRIRFSPRSSFTKHDWVLQNTPTLGDADFTGEYRLRFRAIPTALDKAFRGTRKRDFVYERFPYKVGERCAQMWVEKIIPVEFEEGELENLTDRQGGFGSTGKAGHKIERKSSHTVVINDPNDMQNVGI